MRNRPNRDAGRVIVLARPCMPQESIFYTSNSSASLVSVQPSDTYATKCSPRTLVHSIPELSEGAYLNVPHHPYGGVISFGYCFSIPIDPIFHDTRSFLRVSYLSTFWDIPAAFPICHSLNYSSRSCIQKYRSKEWDSITACSQSSFIRIHSLLYGRPRSFVLLALVVVVDVRYFISLEYLQFFFFSEHDAHVQNCFLQQHSILLATMILTPLIFAAFWYITAASQSKNVPRLPTTM